MLELSLAFGNFAFVSPVSPNFLVPFIFLSFPLFTLGYRLLTIGYSAVPRRHRPSRPRGSHHSITPPPLRQSRLKRVRQPIRIPQTPLINRPHRPPISHIPRAPVRKREIRT